MRFKMASRGWISINASEEWKLNCDRIGWNNDGQNCFEIISKYNESDKYIWLCSWAGQLQHQDGSSA